MTGEEWKQSMSGMSKGKLEEKRVFYWAVVGTMREISDRVWGKGELTDGGKLTYEEDYPVWVYSPPALEKAVNNKGKALKDGTRREIKGGYYPTYLAYKDAIGRKELPFELSGSLRKDWFGSVGKDPVPTEVSPTEFTIGVNEKHGKMIEGLSETKGKFLVLNEAEVEGFYRRVREIYAAP